MEFRRASLHGTRVRSYDFCFTHKIQHNEIPITIHNHTTIKIEPSTMNDNSKSSSSNDNIRKERIGTTTMDQNFRSATMLLSGRDESFASACEIPNKQLSLNDFRTEKKRSYPRLLSPFDNNDDQSNNHDSSDPVRSPSRSCNYWVWEVAALAPVPMYHPIEPTALQLKGIPVSTITSRISKFMWLHSIASSYHTGPTETRIDCLAPQGLVKFTVQLWQQRRKSANRDDDSDRVIVIELQRRQGCGFECQRLRNKLYRAIVSGEDEYQPQEIASRKRINISNFPGNETHTTQGEKDDDTSTTVCSSTVTSLSSLWGDEEDDVQTDALEDCIGLLHSHFYDQNQLGLESLCLLTDNNKVWSSKLVEKVSHQMIYGDDGNEKKAVKDTAPFGCHFSTHHTKSPRKNLIELMEVYFRDIELPYSSTTSKKDCYDTNDEDDEVLAYAKGPHVGIMHLLALRALSNALQNVHTMESSHEDGCPKIQKQDHKRFWLVVSKALVYHIYNAATRPIEASLSAQCIRLLLQTMMIGTETIFAATVSVGVDTPSGSYGIAEIRDPRQLLVPMLTKALDFGRLHNLRLEQESTKLLEYLDALA